MTMQTQHDISSSRRVLLLETDERAGLVAALAAACAAHHVSLEITTGQGHVLLTFAAADAVLDDLTHALSQVGGVHAVHPYRVAASD